MQASGARAGDGAAAAAAAAAGGVAAEELQLLCASEWRAPLRAGAGGRCGVVGWGARVVLAVVLAVFLPDCLLAVVLAVVLADVGTVLQQ